MTDMIDTMVSRLLDTHCATGIVLAAEDGVWPEALWEACVEAGLPLALVEAGERSLGVSVTEAFGIIRQMGRAAAPIPLPETMLANWLLTQAGMEPQYGPLTIVADGLRWSGDNHVSGQVEHVPWGRAAGIVACFEQDGMLRVAFPGREGITTRNGANIAREPRDSVELNMRFDNVPSALLPDGLSLLQIRAAGAAIRCSQIAGAAETITGMTIEYTGQRVQFGKALSKFQAIQQNLALLAEQTAALSAAADMAAEAFGDGIQPGTIAAAKSFAGEAAGSVAAIAHQMHGAMGFSREYPLHYRTRRLWSWREEYGNETEWSGWLGSRLAKAGPDQLWAEITAI